MDADITIPGSKSITNRALIIAALADGESTLAGMLDSDDTRVMIDSLQRLGIAVRANPADQICVVHGAGGTIPAPSAELFVGNSGTSIRFLTALCALGNGEYRLDGVPRMRERPQGDLVEALNTLGSYVDSNDGCPPLIVRANGGLAGGPVTMRAEASSQFVTALLMVAPYARHDMEITVEGALRPHYIDITLRMMQQWGVEVDAGEPGRFRIPSGQRYRSLEHYQIEPDASSASYLFAAAAVTGGRIRVSGLGSKALQGDVRFATEVLPEMGCRVETGPDSITVYGPERGDLRGVDRDMSAISDTSLTLAAIAPFASSPTTIRNIAHSRLQECDRISAAVTELRRLGVMVEERPDGMTIYPAAHLNPATIETYHDHRVAMSFAIAGLVSPGIRILDPACTAKTFPTFWDTLKTLRNG